MSPTSYQTAPPRNRAQSIPRLFEGVNGTGRMGKQMTKSGDPSHPAPYHAAFGGSPFARQLRQATFRWDSASILNPDGCCFRRRKQGRQFWGD